jgi:hypothetical protein
LKRIAPKKIMLIRGVKQWNSQLRKLPRIFSSVSQPLWQTGGVHAYHGTDVSSLRDVVPMHRSISGCCSASYLSASNDSTLSKRCIDRPTTPHSLQHHMLRTFASAAPGRFPDYPMKIKVNKDILLDAKNNNQKLIGAIDQGTSSSRFIVFTEQAKIMAYAQVEHKQYFPEGEDKVG